MLNTDTITEWLESGLLALLILPLVILMIALLIPVALVQLALSLILLPIALVSDFVEARNNARVARKAAYESLSPTTPPDSVYSSCVNVEIG